MRAILAVRADADRVAPWPARAERGSVVRAENEPVAVHGGKSEATRLVLGHVVAVWPTDIVSEKRREVGDNITLFLHASVRRVGLRKEVKVGEK